MVDRTKRWEDEQISESSANADRQTQGCKFAPRCPIAQEDCWISKQPLYRTEPDRAVSCIQYNDSTVLEAQDIGQVIQ
jgi:ABC-type dipeptide/oligopeptide/nickel transport system ATPase component